MQDAHRCRFCRSACGTVVMDLGPQPPSELFPPFDAPGPDPVFPLRLWLCAACGLAQLADDMDVPEDPQGVAPDALTRQAADAVARLASAEVLPRAGTVAEFPSPHGGSWLPLLHGHGLRPAPAGEPADVVVDCSFGLMHAADQAAALRDRAAAVAPGGLLLVQFQSLAGILEQGQWNAVRHGHFAYYSVPVMRRMLAEVGLPAFAAFRFPLYGGTVLVAGRAGAEPREQLETLTDREVAAGVLDPAAVAALGDAVRAGSSRLTDWLVAEQRRGRRVYGYSAASRSVPLLHSAGVGRELLAGVADASRAKQGTRIPGSDIPVIGPGDLIDARPDSVLVFVPDLLDEVRAALPAIESAGGRWVSADEVVVPAP
ncbi:class I SAM-dependent methyltransferase [Pseudonocardia xinjiangensis]|uniref:class I SAM-dependent methyltransferase n=1 Tax=Pseudonocardia xinjiangensis TaxID=75289 RepID=UPI003D8A08DC